jgi:hypothetical protein
MSTGAAVVPVRERAWRGVFDALNTVSRMVLLSEFGQEQEVRRNAS